MIIKDLDKYSNVCDSGKDVTNGKVILKENYPFCVIHGFMNKVSKDGIWRCIMCNVGCFELKEE